MLILKRATHSVKSAEPLDWIAILLGLGSSVYLWSIDDFRWRVPCELLLVQAIAFLLLIVASITPKRRLRSPWARVFAMLVILASWVRLHQQIRVDTADTLVAQYGARQIAEECLRIIQSPQPQTAPSRDSDGLPPGDFPIMKAIPKGFLSWRRAKITGNAQSDEAGYVVMQIDWSSALNFRFDQGSNRYVLVEAFRESNNERLLYAMPVSSQPATQP